MMTWQPQEEPLRQLAQCLKDSLSGHDQALQKNAELMLKQAKASPDINNYLAYLFSNPSSIADLGLDGTHAARCAAAIMLKNNIKISYKTIPDMSKSYIRSTVLLGLQDPNPQIRNFAGNVITEVVRQGGIMGWPQILVELTSLVANEGGTVSPETQEGAMGALLKICEDNKRALDKEYQGQRPLTFLIPNILQFTSSQSAKIRANALACLNVFIPEKSKALLANIDSILLQLFQLSADPSNDVRKHVCRSFVHIADVSPEKIAPHMGGLVDYMVTQQRNPDDAELALDAAEFWMCVGEDNNLRAGLGPYLSKIVPVLLESMVYSEDDILRLEGETEDADEEDREQDIKPQFATAKGARLVTPSGTETPTSNTNGAVKPVTNGYAYEDDDEEEEGEIEEYEDDEEGGDPEEEWNLRKCSAAALDILASVFHGPVFEFTLPYLKDNLNHSEWPNREAAVLALGAIADGCMEFVVPHLPDLTPFLISMLGDKEPVVRKITCWSLGRYSAWASHLDAAGKQQYFEPMMDGILRRMLDKDKRVQEAAASAFANLEEKAQSNLSAYTPVIVQQFVNCFAQYKDRNMFILYDCVQTLAEHVPTDLKRPELVEILMPALIARWNKVSDQSREMFPLLECLSYVASALTDSFAPYAKPIFARCIHIIQQNLEDYWIAANYPAMDQPDKDFLVTSLDLLSAIIQVLDEKKGDELVATSQPNMFEMLAFCMKDNSNEVRQSAYALLGDCAIFVFPRLQPYLPSLLEILIDQLDLTEVLASGESSTYSVLNNACWSCGEIAMRQGAGMAPFVDQLLEKLATILFNAKVPESLNENAAIALGRMSIECPQQLAPHLASFAPSFIRSIHRVDWTDEKGQALKGFVQMILNNPEAMEHCLADFFVEIASAPLAFLGSPNNEGANKAIQNVLMQYRRLIPDFGSWMHTLPPPVEQTLRQTYNL
ncbi:hypothetical protein LTR04_006969 [Oleoguttula sp. CCFEE 6159]|nr:hypothetical protein LTR04_006969 [Oleoguttula sp. CCFEE 6159]